MKKLLPFFLIAGIIIIFFRQFFLQNLLPIPSDTIIGLYNPFRDLYAKDYPRGIPFKNFLITDPVRQQYPWRFESVLQEKSIHLPLWNPYALAGTPLLANGQSAALYPFNALFFLLPFPVAWSLLVALQPFLAAAFMFLYLRNNKLQIVPSLLGSIAFSFSGFFVAWLEWGTIGMSALWLPLLLLVIDKIFSNYSQENIFNKHVKFYKIYLWVLVYLVALTFSFLAGHLQTFFYIFLVQLGYVAIQLFGYTKKKVILLFIASFLIFAVITSIQWIPLFQLILYSAREADHIAISDWFLPWQHLINFFVPDFFGNPATLNYWGIWNYVEFAGYIGLPALFFSSVSLYMVKNRKVFYFLGVTFISLLFSLPTFLAYIPFQLHIPFISTSQPTRLMVLIDFSLSVLAGYGFNYFLGNKKGVYLPILFFSFVFSALWAMIVFHGKFLPRISIENILVAQHNLIFPTSVLVITFLFVITYLILSKRYKSFLFVISISLLLLSVFDSLRFADKFTPFTPGKYLFPSTKSLQFLMSNAGNARIMATDNQILPPNFSVMYHLQDVAGYDPLYIKSYGEYVVALERNNPDVHTPFGFNRLLTPQNYESRLTDLLGVKYVLSLHKLTSSKLKEVFIEGQTIVYENKNAFPRAFFAESVTDAINSQQAVDFLFNSRNNLRNTATVLSFPKQYENFSQGDVIIQQYSAEKILLQTKNSSEGFLVLTDSYYPTWHAYVDGKEVKIYQTDLAFRGIIVPSGTHKVTFTVQLW